jgi:hypothetical protein
MRRYLAAVGLSVVAGVGQAASLAPIQSRELTAVLAYGSELAATKNGDNQPYVVRLIEVPQILAECETVAQCPDVSLYVSVSEGDLNEKPAAYRLPKAKGWQFVRWLSETKDNRPKDLAGFIVRTTIPDANILSAERSRFKSIEYRVFVNASGARFEIR